MRKIKVGDKVRYVGKYWFEYGDELTVVKDDGDIDMPLLCENDSGDCWWLGTNEVELIESRSEIDDLKAEIESLKSRISALEGESKPVKAVDSHKTDDERRAEVIQYAKEFVKDIQRMQIRVNHKAFRTETPRIDFHVNAEKRIVTALEKDAFSGRVYNKSFAKCAPGDVFNADIGKAIAAGRLRGVVIPSEFLNAPQPSEKVEGMVVKTRGGERRTLKKIVTLEEAGNGYCGIDSINGMFSKIINDTNADYSGKGVD